MSGWNPQAHKIFLAVVEQTTDAEKEQLLTTLCGEDAALRAQVESLLATHDRLGSFLEHPAVECAFTATCSELDATPSASDSAASAATGETSLSFLEPAHQPGSLGRLGQYEILETVGRGGMGIVLRAQDTKLQRVVAVKALAPELAANPTARKRFLREAQAAAAVRDDHVVTIHAIEENEQADQSHVPYLVMEYVDGQSLEQKIDQEGPLELKEILRIGLQIATGLSAAHAQGLIHRDIKPANILLENGVERVKITDFGLARAADDVSITRSGVVAGTPQYMSPEQAQCLPVDQRSDLFSLGCVMYSMCTGRSPFRAESTIAAIRRVCDDTPRAIREINPEIPDWLSAIIDRLLAKPPEQRFQSAVEVAELLGQHLAHVQDPGATPFPSKSPPQHEVPSRRRWFLAGIMLVAITSTLGLTEATGVTRVLDYVATVLRIRTPQGTLVLEIDDPDVNVAIEGNGEKLTISGAGIEKLELRPGQYQVRTTKDGKPLKEELVTITRGGKEVLRVGLEAEPAGVAHALPKPEAGAFVVLGDEGDLEKKFDTLAEAVFASSDGDTIEIRGNGPFSSEPIALKGQALRIRAAEGLRPEFCVGPPEQPQANAEFITTDSLLVLEGLDLRTVGSPRVQGKWARQNFIRSHKAPLYVANCRFIKDHAQTVCWVAGSPVCEVRNCLFSATAGIGVDNHSAARIVLDNNVIIAGMPLRVGCQKTSYVSLQLTRNTLLGEWLIHFAPRLPPDALGRDGAGAVKALRIQASGNVFDGGDKHVYYFTPGNPIERPGELLQRMTSWSGERNLYAARALLAADHHTDAAMPLGARLAEWRQFWGGTDIDSVESRVCFVGGNHHVIRAQAPERLIPEACRLHPDSAGHRAGKDGKDLGADIDLVGPGEAYERWKKTPEYQEWLDETGGQRPHRSTGTGQNSRRSLRNPRRTTDA